MIPRTVLRASGAAVAALVLTGLAADIRSFDPTSGGYEPPYESFTGEPIDWSQTRTTAEGMRKRGHVVSVTVDCTTGMMHFEALGLRYPFRELSPRALTIHKPREACAERGFTPAF
jgi:hypothetical protein